MLDESGTLVLWGWIPETRPETEFEKSDWSGRMGLSRILTVGPSNELGIVLLPELHSLRRAQSQDSSFPAYRGEIVATMERPRGGEAVAVGPQHAPTSASGSLQLSLTTF